MSVEIEPSELGFRRLVKTEVSQTLVIKNPNQFPLAFKVKTTAPKQYCVRPNSGRVEPYRSVEVTALKQELPPDYKCRDKFLVQSVPITGQNEFVSIQDIWDKVSKGDIQEKKIRVTFLPAETETAQTTPARAAPASMGEATPDVPPPAYMSPHEDSKGTNGVTSTTDSSPESKTYEKSRDVVTPVTPATTGKPISDSESITIATLKAQLAETQALIASLQRDGGLRQRKAAATTEGAAGASDASAAAPELRQVARQGTEGVPIHITAGLCLVMFLLGYLFF